MMRLPALVSLAEPPRPEHDRAFPGRLPVAPGSSFLVASLTRRARRLG